MLKHKEQIGALDQRVTFQQVIVGANESNEDEELGWEDIAVSPQTWASREDLSGSEQYAADRLTGFQTCVFKVRYRSDITIKMRMLCNNIAYNIISIAEIGRKRFLRITTESGYDYIEA